MFGPLRLALERVVRKGDLRIYDSKGQLHRFGDGTGRRVVVRITDAKSERAIGFDPGLGVGESYMNGTFVFEEGRIYEFLELVFENSEAMRLPTWMRGLDVLRYVTRRIQQFNPTSRSRRNVKHHYDITPAIYDLFLDRDRQYSCAYFEAGSDDLDAAQLAKKRHLAAKLALQPGQRVLDIGSGWGGLGLYIAKAANVHVTGVTLSDEQFALSRERAQREGLGKVVEFKLQDYRHVPGPFERIVSVGMFEHVGINHYKTYFNRVRDLLTDDGVAVIHSIGRSDGPSTTNPFIAKYIFPGGYIPALSEVLPAIEKSGLHVTDVEILRLHYADTLRHWRNRFIDGWDKAKAELGEEFCRMWEFYLAGSESAFRWQNLMIFQIQLSKKLGTLPLTRDYMIDEERRLKAREAGTFETRMAGE
ncbi:MAG: cyclopropane-fatty-acyl-phospholipid synthase family protein [Hyphomicrobiaceae bacterium]